MRVAPDGDKPSLRAEGKADSAERQRVHQYQNGQEVMYNGDEGVVHARINQQLIDDRNGSLHYEITIPGDAQTLTVPEERLREVAKQVAQLYKAHFKDRLQNL